MKTREAKRIARSVENGGNLQPVHVLRKVALRLGRPLKINVQDADLLFYPKGLTGRFATVTNYNPWTDAIVNVKDADPDDYDYFRELDLKPGDQRMTLHAGSDIEWGCKLSCRLARAIGVVVPFDFNGLLITARPHSRHDDLYDYWQQESERKRAEYLASDEYKQQLIEDEAERVEYQGQMDALLERLPTVTRGPQYRDEDQDAFLDWMYDFGKIADYNFLSWDKAVVVDRIQTAGWEPGVHTMPDGLTPEEEKNFRLTIRTDKRVDAEYIIGQCLDCMLGGMPPHPVVCKFIDEYRESFNKAA